MSNVLTIDFETRSTVDLRKSGADVYARHPSTDIMCLGFAVNDEPVQLWKPGDKPFKKIFGDTIVVGHNVGGFEVPLWNNVGVRKYGWEPLNIEQCVDTMAMSYAMALPGSLAEAAPAAGIAAEKDAKGHRVMMQLSQPRKVIEGGCPFCSGDFGVCDFCYGTGSAYDWYTPESHPEKFEALYAYCRQDIEVERELYKRLLRLSPSEQALWVLDHKINQRGVRVDLDAAKKAIRLVEAEKKRLDALMREVTSNSVATCSATGQLTDWIKWQGVELEGVAKSDVVELLEREDLPPSVRAALLLRQEAAKSSTAKLESMMRGACEDGRLRGMFQYWGAGATGRWAGRRVQLQNLPRPTIPQAAIEHVFEVLNALP